MAHTPVFKRFLHLLQQSRYFNAGNNPQQRSLQSGRRRFLQTLAGVAGSSVLNGCAGLLRDEYKTVRVAIVGGGLAGLSAAYHLQKAGIYADVYEAGQRLGGRIFSQSNALGDGLSVEFGGEFINSDHADMLALVQDFGLTLFDRRLDADKSSIVHTRYFFHEQSWPEQELVMLLAPLVAQIEHDAQLIEQDWQQYGHEFDRISVQQYLQRHAALIPHPLVYRLFEAAIRVEYGAETVAASALQLLFLLPKIDEQKFELLGYSDEAYTVRGGNTRIIAALQQSLSGRIHTGHALAALMNDRQQGFTLAFKHGALVNADYVIIAMPFNALRHVSIKIDLPEKLWHFIRYIDLGRNEKLLAGYRRRVWREAAGFALSAWTDLGFSSLWDATQWQTDKTRGVLTYYSGGSEVQLLHDWPGGLMQAGSSLSQRLDRFVPGLHAESTQHYSLTNWHQHPYIGGSYVNFSPGQLSEYEDYFWVESAEPAQRQSVNVGRLIFAGEHLSNDFYGFMNGAAQTGRLAAGLVVEMIIGATPAELAYG